MKSFRFLHTADLHLGTPFRGLLKNMQESFAKQITAAADDVAKRIVDIAIEHHVDFVTLAGDSFDVQDVGMYIQFELMRQFERLEAQKIPVYMTHGNHDPLIANRFLRWPANVHVFDAVPANLPQEYQVPSTVLQLDEATRVQISGFSYGSQAMFTPMASYFRRLPDVDFALGLYHGAIGQDGEHANYCSAKPDDLMKCGFDFWGLGHIHKPMVIREQNPVILYPGNPQGRHIRESGVRGTSLIDVASSKLVQVTFLPVSSIIWNKIEVSVDGCDTMEAIRSRVIHTIAQYIRSQSVSSVIRVVVRGQTEAHSEMNEAAFRLLLEDEAQARHWPIYIEQVELRIAPVVDERVLIHSDSYVGSVLRTISSFEGELEKTRHELLPELEDVFHAANGLSVHELSVEALGQLLAEAKRQLMKYLVSPIEVDS